MPARVLSAPFGPRHSGDVRSQVGVDWTFALIAVSVVWIGVALLPPWMAMWLTAIATFGTLKVLTWRRCLNRSAPATSRDFIDYVTLWPGMDPNEFLRRTSATDVSRRDWFLAVTKTWLGIAIVIGAAAPAIREHATAAAFAAATGLVLSLHCGAFHLLANFWRRKGRDVRPIMYRPLAARKLSEFWGRRWNRAFPQIAVPLVFRPVARRYGTRVAGWSVFLFSGVVHDVVMSVPAGGGYGRPTLYFLIQAVVADLLRRLDDRESPWLNSAVQRTIAATAVLLPLPLLCHAAFRNSCLLPMLDFVAGR